MQCGCGFTLKPHQPAPRPPLVSTAHFSPSHAHFVVVITATTEPTRFSEAVQHAPWRAPMRNEIEALERNNTWVLSELSADKKAIGCKWVYKINYRANGEVEHYKARLVVFGNRQVEGDDYNEKFAPVAKMVTIRIFLSIAAIRGWDLH
ncbi:unnamed protein product [Rhodiola kirilowii]